MTQPQDWVIYRRGTGRLVALYKGPEPGLNVPVGCAAMPGTADLQRQRVVRVSDDGPELVEWIPDAPADDDMQAWVWSAEAWRWQPVPTLHALRSARIAAVDAAMAAVDAQRVRPLAEAAIAQAGGAALAPAAITKLHDTEQQLNTLRATRAAIASAATQAELDAIT